MSAVTSPGFTSRLSQRTQQSHNPLRESNSSPLKGSSFQFPNPVNSPLKLGQLPASSWKHHQPLKLKPPSFSSPVNTGRFSLTRKKKHFTPLGTTFVHIAPVDIVNKTTSNTTTLPKNSGNTRQLDKSTLCYGGLGGYPSPPNVNISRMPKIWSPAPPMVLDSSATNTQVPNNGLSHHDPLYSVKVNSRRR